MNTRIRFELDQDPDHSYLERWDTPKKYATLPAFENGVELDFDAYMAKYGTPDCYVSYGALLERRCDAGEWHVIESVWGFDILVDDDPYVDGKTFASLVDVPEILRFALDNNFDFGDAS